MALVWAGGRELGGVLDRVRGLAVRGTRRVAKARGWGCWVTPANRPHLLVDLLTLVLRDHAWWHFHAGGRGWLHTTLLASNPGVRVLVRGRIGLVPGVLLRGEREILQGAVLRVSVLLRGWGVGLLRMGRDDVPPPGVRGIPGVVRRPGGKLHVRRRWGTIRRVARPRVLCSCVR